MPAQVIFLNGSSSAGKTTLAKHLQKALPGCWQHMALDHFRDGLPDKYRGLNAPEHTLGAQGLNVIPVTDGTTPFTRVVFGDAGKHARAAVGSSSLPLGVAVEIEGIFQIR